MTDRELDSTTAVEEDDNTWGHFFALHGGEWIGPRMGQASAARDTFGLIRPVDVDPDPGAAQATLELFRVTPQAPSASTKSPKANLETLLRAGPSTRRLKEAPRLQVGSPAPDFTLVGSDGSTVTLSDLRGTPFAIRLTRAIGSGIICPGCHPGLNDLIRTQKAFEELGARFLVVFASSQAQVGQVAETLNVPYPIYADPDWDLFKAYQTGYTLGGPTRGWVVVDGEGVIRFIWRLPLERNADMMKVILSTPYVEADRILEEIKSL
jgi:peroxiredoxin Q/BCP